MKLEQAVLEKIVDQLKKVLAGCPVCGRRDWAVGQSIHELREFAEGGLTFGGPVIPLLPVTCNHCGNTLLFNAIRLGAVSQKAQEPEKVEG